MTDAAQGREGSGKMAAEATHGGWRVLIVDDEDNLNWSLVTSLRKDGYTVDGAQTGEEALMRLQAAEYDCVVSDVKMPGMDGFELLQWLRQNRPRTRVVMMTAFGSPTARQDALRGGVVAYFEKPFDLRALRDELRRMAATEPATQDPAGYDLLDVAQVISLARRDIALDVQSGGYAGVLRFVGGELVWAEAGELRGDEAFFALCVPRPGRASPLPWDGRTPRNVTQPVSRLIYIALGMRDGRATAHTARVSATGSRPSDPPAPRPASHTTPILVPDVINTVQDLASLSTSHTAMPSAADTGATAPLTAARVTGGPDTGALKDALWSLANALPAPCGVVWLSFEGAVLWQRWNGQSELYNGTLTHLAAAAQAASRAALTGDLGSLDHLVIETAERRLLLRRIGRGDRGGLVLVALAPEASTPLALETIRARLGGPGDTAEDA
jgi:CheY-like chemotaxis protein/predicted regulator of Ras-like GTPase activity (Roadblock/LC7/MglB family)